ncbi:MAG: hypothetical protein O7H40_15530, partial [Gammaproteobacteria bacterium]|nr:hypothetical protein [Gammaproteobacteria bacterium]
VGALGPGHRFVGHGVGLLVRDPAWYCKKYFLHLEADHDILSNEFAAWRDSLMRKTIPALKDFMSDQLNVDRSRCTHIARRCREARLLTQGKSGPAGVLATSRDAAILLYAILVTEPGDAIRSSELVEPLLDLRAGATEGKFGKNFTALVKPGEDPASLDPITMMGRIIDIRRADTSFKMPLFFVVSRGRSLMPIEASFVWNKSLRSVKLETVHFFEVALKQIEAPASFAVHNDGSVIEVRARSRGFILANIADWLEGRELTVPMHPDQVAAATGNTEEPAKPAKRPKKTKPRGGK